MTQKLFLWSGVRPKPSEWELHGGGSAKILALLLASHELAKYFVHVSLNILFLACAWQDRPSYWTINGIKRQELRQGLVEGHDAQGADRLHLSYAILGALLGLCWCSAGALLGLFWSSPGALLEFSWGSP